MSKELKALENIVGFITWYDKSGCPEKNQRAVYKEDIDIIETALKDYEKKTKLAKEYADVNNVAKRLKAFEIIKNKKVNVLMFVCYANSGKNGFKMYNQAMENEELQLTQEEFRLLKEVLL